MKVGSRAVRRLPEVLEDAPSSVLPLPVLEDQEAQVGHGILDHPAGRGETLRCFALEIPKCLHKCCTVVNR